MKAHRNGNHSAASSIASRLAWPLAGACVLATGGIILYSGLAPSSSSRPSERVLDLVNRGGCGGPSALMLLARSSGDTIAPLLDGMGDHTMEVTTDSPEAQKYFNQGLTLAYGFNHAEAARSFKQAAILDPECAMAWWGYALVLGPNINMPMEPDAVPEACEALDKALRLAPNATEREQAYIHALARRYDIDVREDRTHLDEAYAQAMRELAARYPDDLDAQTLCAEALMDLHPWDFWTPDGRARPWTQEIIKRLEAVLDEDPSHPGANHLYIHVVEASQTPQWGEPAADRLRTIVPGSGHLTHMPGHIYLRVGRYQDCYDTNVHAVAADERYLESCETQGIYPAAYYPHNIHFLWASASMLGQKERAFEAARKVAGTVDPGAAKDFQMFYVVPMYTMVRFAMWDDALAEPRPDDDLVFSNAIWHYARGCAHAAKGNTSKARDHLYELRRLLRSDELEPELIFLVSSPAQVLEVAEASLAGDIARADGDLDAAIAHYTRAVNLEDALAYNEPEDWHLPCRHLLGDALLAAGRYREAEAVYWQDLKDHPDNGWALLGLHKALVAQGEERAEEAANIRARFEREWAEADIRPSSSRM